MTDPAPAGPPGARLALPVAALCLAALSLLFWKLRILDTAVIEAVSIPNIDIFVGQAPMTAYAFEELRAGHLPLWNPYQLCGAPFLAVTYVGLFYPPNWIFLWLDVPTGIEVSFLLHMLLGALGMWTLSRRLELGSLAGVAAGLTFVWSGFVVHWANQPQLFAALAWAPWTVTATHATLSRASWGLPALALAVAFQVFNGAMEILLHTLYLAGGYAAVGLLSIARHKGISYAATTGGMALGGVLLGVALSAVQLLPTLELVAQSARAPGQLGFEELVLGGRLEPAAFAASALAAKGLSSTGVLSLLALALGAGLRAQRSLWAFAVAIASLSVWLAFGGELFRLYTELPVGTLFRRPYKFLDLYDFAQALLVALAVASLLRWAPLTRRELWRHPAFALGAAWAALLSLLCIARGEPNPALWLLTGGIFAYAGVAGARPRAAIVVALVAVHAASLFFGVENRYVRPIHLPRYAEDHAERNRLSLATSRMRHERMYLSPTLWFMKQGLLRRVPVVADYEPLALSRYANYFETASGFRRENRPFNGRYFLTADTKWPMMDLTGTRFYVLNPWDLKLHSQIAAQGPAGGFAPLPEEPRRIVERPAAMPRVWVVGASRQLADEAEVLATLADPAFDPRATVLLEAPTATPGGEPGPAGSAQIASYQAEQVVVSVDAERAGWLVLSDLFYPGWQAHVDGVATPISRANSLFRAVPIPAGTSEVRFAYRPESLRGGAAVSTLALLAFAGGAAFQRRRRRSSC